MIFSPMRHHRAIILRIIIICAVALPLNGCFKFLFEGDAAPLNNKTFDVPVPTGSLPPKEKLLPQAEGENNTNSPKISGTPLTNVEARLLSHEPPANSDPLKIILPEPNRPAGNNALYPPISPRDSRTVVKEGDFSYENATIEEDVTWHGTILVRGYVVIAPQATLRIEPGTVVRFMPSSIMRQAPYMVILGRLQCNGSLEKPVLFAPNFADATKGDWGGILFLSSEKRNQCDYCRIEGAATAIESRYSSLSSKGLTIYKSGTGLYLRDSVVTLSQTTIRECEKGIEAYDSELELRDGSIADNQRGIDAHRSALVLTSVSVKESAQQGVTADECRIKFNSCELSGNSVGALLKGGEGQILMSRFTRNHDVGLHLSSARIKIQRCLFADNSRDGISMDDGCGIVWSSAFYGNGGFNLVNNGHEKINAVLNWWGSDNEAAIASKLLDRSKDTRLDKITFSPWLTGKPIGIP